MKPAVNPLNRACRIRIRPDLGARVIPGFPWNNEAYNNWKALQRARVSSINIFG